MPINSFSIETYIAFSDLNGFQDMMRNHEKAANALDKFYNTIYLLKAKPEYSSLQSLAILDCAISFISNTNSRSELPLILNEPGYL